MRGQDRWIGLSVTGQHDKDHGLEVQFRVQDHGRGISASDIHKIFEPFDRAPDVVAAQIQGAGLGLSLSNRIVESLGGKISVVSELGKGSTFTLHLRPRRLGKSSIGPFPEAPDDLLPEFPNDDACLEYIKGRVWPNGIAHCVKCGVARKHYRVTGRKAYAGNHCGRHIYPLAGTIFSKSTTPLRTWFYILFLMLSTRGLLSARQIQGETGVTYKTA